MYNMGMNKVISTTEARKDIAKMVNAVREHGAVFAIGRRNEPEVLMIKFPKHYSKELGDITNINAYSKSFDFLADEPDLYSLSDLKKRYV
jgi:D-arabinose 1-dehydrogenase-like Zn-dependent alcohol dehydrogenase